MSDNIYIDFVERQGLELTELCESSSRLECKLIQSDASVPPNIFLVKLSCAHLVNVDDEVQRSTEPSLIAIQLPRDYVRRAYPNPGQILSLVVPRNCFHPNVFWPHICTGHIAPGTPVIELVLRSYEILTYNKFTPREDNCLNPAACRWARARMAEFPLERGALRDVHIDGSSEPVEIADFELETDAAGAVS